ncbi:MAG: lysoplasmalogenase [Firmicutes bacterium]|nr:lysoplasmalogenase [Bacillota bacterium]
MTALIITAVLAALATVGFIAVRILKAPIYGLFAKIVASVGFITISVTALTIKDIVFIPYGAPLIILGLVLGLIGDIVLDVKRIHGLSASLITGESEFEVNLKKEHIKFEGLYLTSGMVSFFAGHIVFLVAVCLIATEFFGLTENREFLFPIAVSAGIGIAMGPVTIIISEKLLKADFGKHKILAGAYGGLLIFFTVFTLWLTILEPAFLLLFLGTLCFLLSDLVLSQMYFCEGKKEDKILVAVNHALYYSAQILIACWLFTLVL